MSKSIRSYSSPFNFGHKALERLFDGEVVVQEKMDGSQISFHKNAAGELFARSRKVEIIVSDEDNSMFAPALKTIIEIQEMLTPGWIYRGEFFAKPKQNTFVYGRIPDNHIILFDIDRGDQDYLSPEELANEARNIGLESVPVLAVMKDKPTVDELKALLSTESILGGKMEGVVLKNYDQFGIDKKTLMAKYVSEAFKEKHTKEWKKSNPGAGDFVLSLAEDYRTEARWAKAVQHLIESGEIEGVVQDIPVLMREINQDILEECEEEIKDRLFKHFWKVISRKATVGFPEWYKNYLVERSLE